MKCGADSSYHDQRPFLRIILDDSVDGRIQNWACAAGRTEKEPGDKSSIILLATSTIAL